MHPHSFYTLFFFVSLAFASDSSSLGSSSRHGPHRRFQLQNNATAPAATAPTTRASPTFSSAASATALGWTLSRPFAVDTTARILQGYTYSNSLIMTPQACQLTCALKGYHTAGVEDGSDCFCGNAYIGGAPANVASSECNVACSGASSLGCGGRARMVVYTNTMASLGEMWQTNWDKLKLLAPLSISPTPFTAVGPIAGADITLDETKTYQTMDGFGVRVTPMSTSPPRKRPRSETQTLTPGTDSESFSFLGQYSFGSLQDYLTVLRRVEVGLDSCANPTKLISLPFPSLLKSPIQSRHGSTGQYNFKHMGRAIFTAIVSEIQRLDRQTAAPVVLLGTYGCGKSHLLAVLASFLFSQHKRVVFLPEASSVAEDVLPWLKLAFALPFADLPETLERIAQFKTIQDFVDFARAWNDGIYFLVDGMDQLEGEFKDALLAMSSGHFQISTAYSLAKSSRTRVSTIRLPPGMPLDEFRQWMTHFSSRLPICTLQQVLFLHYVSGGVPALQLLFLDPHSEHLTPDLVAGSRNRAEYQAIADNLGEFHANVIETLTASDKSRYISLMMACLTETVPELRHGSHQGLYDHRYVFFDDDGAGHVICGFARDTLIALIRAEDQAGFASDAWYSAVRSSNLAIRDSAIGQICMTRIAVAGLTQAEAQGNAMRICTFRQNPSFGTLFEEAWKNPQGTSSFLNIAGPEVCGVINAVILRINPSAKTAQLIPLQISTNHTCTDLATLFFAVTWHRWERAIQEEGFKVVNTFACVDSCTPESAEVISAGTAFREKVKMFSPEYSVRNLNVATLDPKLGRILRGDKYQSPPI